MTEHSIDLALLVLRVAAGAVFLAHGINHIFGGGKIKGTAGWFESLGMKPGYLHAWTASLTEIGAGGLLVLGLLTPVAAAGVIGVMLVAWITNHARNGFFIFRKGEGYEYVMTLTVVGLVIAILGPGNWSVDHAAGPAAPPHRVERAVDRARSRRRRRPRPAGRVLAAGTQADRSQVLRPDRSRLPGGSYRRSERLYRTAPAGRKASLLRRTAPALRGRHDRG